MGFSLQLMWVFLLTSKEGKKKKKKASRSSRGGGRKILKFKCVCQIQYSIYFFKTNLQVKVHVNVKKTSLECIRSSLCFYFCFGKPYVGRPYPLSYDISPM